MECSNPEPSTSPHTFPEHKKNEHEKGAGIQCRKIREVGIEVLSRSRATISKYTLKSAVELQKFA